MPREARSLELRLARVMEQGPLESPEARFDLAVAEFAAGRTKEAEALFTGLAAESYVAYRGAAMPSLPRFYLGRLAALRGDWAAALGALAGARSEAPNDPFVLASSRRTAILGARRARARRLLDRRRPADRRGAAGPRPE